MAAGTGNGLLAGGPFPIGDVICFEVAYDGLVRSSVAAGAQLLVVQTNNATFGVTGETYQQLAMSQLRAVEHGRTVLQASTSGVSAVIGPGRPDPAAHRRPVHRGRAGGTRAAVHGDHSGRPGGLRRGAGAGRAAVLAAALAALVSRRRRPAASRRRDREAGRRVTPEDTRVLVVIPTYDERENLEPIVTRVLAAVPGAHVLVVDDGSPDGTGELADALAAADPRVHVLHRRGKDGLGAAYIAGFDRGLEDGYDVLVEMDADGSHAPEQLPQLLAALADADVVLGSRWVPGGAVVELAPAARAPVPRRQPLHPSRAGHRRCATPPRATGPTAAPSSRRSTTPAWRRRGTASRSTSPGGRCRRASGSSRCRSPSPSASAARAR